MKTFAFENYFFKTDGEFTFNSLGLSGSMTELSSSWRLVEFNRPYSKKNIFK